MFKGKKKRSLSIIDDYPDKNPGDYEENNYGV